MSTVTKLRQMAQKNWLGGMTDRIKNATDAAAEIERLHGDRIELHNGLTVLLQCLDNPAKIKALRPQLDELVERTAPKT